MITQNNQYNDTRSFFHTGREPAVFFYYDGAIFQATLTAHWKGGIELSLAEFHVKPGNDRIDKLSFGEPHLNLVIENLKIRALRPVVKNGKVHLDLEAADPESHSLLTTHIRNLKASSGRREKPGFSTDRLPGSTVRTHYSQSAVDKRKAWVEQVSGVSLNALSRSIFEPDSLAGNIENYIGAVQIPVGIAGPVLVRGDYVDGYVPVPIATTEGALVRSICRGAKVCSTAGGIEVSVRKQEMIRAPVFFCEDMRGALNLERWVLDHRADITIQAEKTSSIARLRELKTHVFDNTLHILFCYTTGDASGQNMTTCCTYAACEWIRDKIERHAGFRFQQYYIEGNMSGDKKLSNLNLSGERGVSVVATCYVPGNLLRRHLRIDARTFMRLYQSAEVSGLRLGIAGQNINFANVIAGIFTATGQDIACVHESSAGIFKAREEDNGLFFSVSLPGLVIGTVGGGTRLPTQKECLEMIGCSGAGKLYRFAEIIAATCLALDVSTGSAILSNDFVSAHDSLGRNRPGQGLSASELNPAFLNSMVGEDFGVIREAVDTPLDFNDGILSELTQNSRNSRTIGLHRYRLTVDRQGKTSEISAVLKLKDIDKNLIEKGKKLAMLAGDGRLAGLFSAQSDVFNVEDSHIRELYIYRDAPEKLRQFLPDTFGVHVNTKRNIYALLMEDLSGYDFHNTANTPQAWTRDKIELVLSEMARMHAAYFEDFDSIPTSWRVAPLDAGRHLRCVELLRELTQVNCENHAWFDQSHLPREIAAFIDAMGDNIKIMRSSPMTLTHNDFNPRNLCISRDTNRPRLKLYDWELALFQNPQRDLVEFLAYVFPDAADADTFHYFTEYYRSALSRLTGKPLPGAEYTSVLRLNVAYFAAVRLNLYLMGHNLLKFDYLERLCRNASRFAGEFLSKPMTGTA